MSLDCTSMILAPFSSAPNDGYVSDVLRMTTDSVAAGKLSEVAVNGKAWAAIQLPAGEHSGRLGQTSSEGESGWLTEDPYGSPVFNSLTGAEIYDILKDERMGKHNIALLRVLNDLFADRDVVLYFS